MWVGETFHSSMNALMESIKHVKWVAAWVSYFHTTRHKVPSMSVCPGSTVTHSRQGFIK